MIDSFASVHRAGQKMIACALCSTAESSAPPRVIWAPVGALELDDDFPANHYTVWLSRRTPPPETAVNRNQLISRYLEPQQQLVDAFTACPCQTESIQRLTEEVTLTRTDIRRLHWDSEQANHTAMAGRQRR